MEKKIIPRSFALLIIAGAFTVLTALAQTGKPLTKATLPGYPVFIVTNSSMMPIGATGGVVTLSKTADNTDQQFTNDSKNKKKFATLDVVVYDASGHKTQSIHFTNLVISSVTANFQGVTTVGLTFDTMTKN